MRIGILPTGGLRTGSYCGEYQRDEEGRIPLKIHEGARVEDVVTCLGIPASLVAGVTGNGVERTRGPFLILATESC